MTCETTRQRLLHSERPDRPPADVQPHLADCAACRAWQRGLTRLERRVTEIDVPPSAPPPDLIRQVLHGPPPLPDAPLPGLNGGTPPWWASASAPAPIPAPAPWWVNNPVAERNQPAPAERRRHHPTPSPHPERARRKVALAFALTTGLAVFALCWGLWPHSASEALPVPRTAFTVRQERLERQLSTARTPNERFRIADEFAGKLKREALDMVRTDKLDDLEAVASLYVHVISERLPQLVRSLPPEQREAVLRPVLDGLRGTDSQMETEAQRLLDNNISPAAVAPLRDIARAARDGQNRLEAMLREV